MSGLLRHTEIGHEEKYVSDHNLRKVQEREDRSPSLMQQNADTKAEKAYGLYRHRDVCSMSVKLDAQENILERIDG